MTYLILSTPSEDYARSMSAALYTLSAPAGAQTQYAVGWVMHPTTGDVALRLGNEGSYLQPDADVSAFVSLLPITPDEADALTATLDAARGTHLRYVDMLPESLTDGMRTQEQMDADGWWPIDLNTAGEAELQRLNHVGPERAKAIIDGRPWSSLVDLTQSDGISEATIDGWGARVTVGP